MEVVQSNQPAIRWLVIPSLSLQTQKFCIYFFFFYGKDLQGMMAVASPPTPKTYEFSWSTLT